MDGGGGYQANFWGWMGCRLCWNTEGVLRPVNVMVCQGKCALGEGGYATEGEKVGCLLLSWPRCVIQQQEECVRQPHPSSEERRLGSPASPGFLSRNIKRQSASGGTGMYWLSAGS